MVKEGLPFTLIPLVIAGILAAVELVLGLSVFIWIVAAAFLLLAMFMAFFFRDPLRLIPTEEDIIVSAADGRVTRIEHTEEGKLVSVFLSPVDVHINRSPIAGRVRRIDYQRGRKIPATRNEASLVNERNSLEIEGEKMTVVCTQIAGILARRIVCWSKVGDQLSLGEKFGLIKFSSRTDLLMPENVKIQVDIGDRVIGGETIIGRLEES